MWIEIKKAANKGGFLYFQQMSLELVFKPHLYLPSRLSRVISNEITIIWIYASDNEAALIISAINEYLSTVIVVVLVYMTIFVIKHIQDIKKV